jgi:hypothetical protein
MCLKQNGKQKNVSDDVDDTNIQTMNNVKVTNAVQDKGESYDSVLRWFQLEIKE